MSLLGDEVSPHPSRNKQTLRVVMAMTGRMRRTVVRAVCGIGPSVADGSGINKQRFGGSVAGTRGRTVRSQYCPPHVSLTMDRPGFSVAIAWRWINVRDRALPYGDGSLACWRCNGHPANT